MKNLIKLILLTIISLVSNVYSVKNLRKSHSSTHSKKSKSKQIIIDTPLTQVSYPVSLNTGSYTYTNALTPLTTGTFSSGGQIYQTNANAIPYGTGYSYGPWQKIPTF